MSNQAGWKCDVCRKSGLERKRRCGWLGIPEDAKARPVWARKQVALETCPTGYITAESQTLLEEFFVRRRLSAADLGEPTARQVEAFVILERELALEMNDGQHNTRQNL